MERHKFIGLQTIGNTDFLITLNIPNVKVFY